MNTNAVTQVTEIGHRLFNLPGWIIAWSFTLIMCAAFKKTRDFPDKYIWPFAFLVCAAGTMIFAPDPPPHLAEWKWHVANFLLGATVGTLEAKFYSTVVSALVARYPLFKFLVPSDGTAFFYPPKESKPVDNPTESPQPATNPIVKP